MRLINYLILLTVPCLSFLSRDDGQEPSIGAFKEWYLQHKDSLVFKTDFEELNYQLRYNPRELRLMNAIVKKEVVGKKEIASWYKDNSGMEEFSFKISCPKNDILAQYSEDKEEYNKKLFYFIESASFDFLLVRKLDTIAPRHYQFENHYSTVPFITLYLAFDKSTKNNPVRELIFSDQAFSGSIIPLDITRLNNLNIPKIK